MSAPNERKKLLATNRTMQRHKQQKQPSNTNVNRGVSFEEISVQNESQFKENAAVNLDHMMLLEESPEATP